MSEDNVDLLMEAFRRFKLPLDHWAELWDPETRMSVPEGWPEPGPFIGLEAVRREFEHGLTNWSDFSFEDMKVVSDPGDWVVVTYRLHTEGATSGIEADVDLASAYRVQDGRLSECIIRWNIAEVLEAAGLSE